ncbi:cytochrome P450 [Mycena albidolilacea]|uniref:Cytochrome P450 n=1 Tax=Mycena albidolilacea TaxID=1033008 RepID=A0AAD6ZHD9_9AGAR|nr:cytochrome P450 [Mycena albidolilacea]
MLFEHLEISMSSTAIFVALLAALALSLIIRGHSTLPHITGPPSASWIFGNMIQLLLPPQLGDYEFAWRKLYGPVYKLKACFGEDRLMVSDPIALQYILNSQDFDHGPVLALLMDWFHGERAVIGRKGKDHRHLRAALNIGFTGAAVRQYHPVFEKVAHTISEKLDHSNAVSIDMCPLLSTAALDAISQVVLGYPLEDLGADFVTSNLQVVNLATTPSASQILADAIIPLFPLWLVRKAIYLPMKTFKLFRTNKYLANREGQRAVREKMEIARQGLEPSNDVFSLLLNSNQPDDARKSLTEEDIVGQTAVLMLAGQETTANTLAFGLVELAKNPELQETLRTEIHATLSTGGSNVAYDSMPLLNAFIKEALRMFPALPFPERKAVQDTVIPLSESIALKTGQRINQVPVRKGQTVFVGIASYQQLQSRWGDDAEKYRPSRWIDGTVSPGEGLGPYANLLTFLGGPHTCLGWRFAILEMQVVVCELVGKFSFSLPVDHLFRSQFAGTMQPVDANGKKSALLCVKRIM